MTLRSEGLHELQLPRFKSSQGRLLHVLPNISHLLFPVICSQLSNIITKHYFNTKDRKDRYFLCMADIFNGLYPRAEGPERTAVCIFYGMGYVEWIMAAGARREIEVFSCVDPVIPIRVISRWFQYVGFAFERYETPAERGGGCVERLGEMLHNIYFAQFKHWNISERK